MSTYFPSNALPDPKKTSNKSTHYYSTGSAKLDEQITRMVQEWSPNENVDLLRELIITVYKLSQDPSNRGDLKLMNNSLKELRYAFKAMEPYRGIRKVTIFGSARTKKDAPEYQQAIKFGELMAQKGWMVITGAGGGIMEAGHEGAGRNKSIGFNIRLPWEQSANPIIERDPKLVTFKYFFTRKLNFIKESDAIALFPGGFGTYDETYEALTLMQTGKSKIIPVLCIDKARGTFWRTWKRFLKEHLLNHGLVSPEDMHLFKVTDKLDEATAEIDQFYRNFHSSRFVNEKLVLRMYKPLSKEKLATLNKEFGSLVKEGSIEQVKAHAKETETEPDIAHLPRLSFTFNRIHYGKLRVLIDRINEDEPAKLSSMK